MVFWMYFALFAACSWCVILVCREEWHCGWDGMGVVAGIHARFVCVFWAEWWPCLVVCVVACLLVNLPALVPACISACLLVCMPAFLHACLPAGLFVCPQAGLLACLPCRPACLFVYMPAFMSSCLPAFLPACSSRSPAVMQLVGGSCSRGPELSHAAAASLSGYLAAAAAGLA
jgi:hypothetical protein